MLPLALEIFTGLLAFSEPQPATATANPSSMIATATVSNITGVESALHVLYGGAEVRLWAAQPFSWEDGTPGFDAFSLAGGLAFPYVRAGTVRPAGLAAFLCRPAAAGPILLAGDGSPLELENPKDSSYFGVSAGEDFGLLYLAPASVPGNAAYGAWVSPRGGWFSVIAAGGEEIAHSNGDDWYDPPEPAAERVWAAASAEAGGRLWAFAAAGAVGASFPGVDFFAARAEGWVRLGRLRFEAEASSASAFWRGFDGKAAPPFRVDAGWRYTRRGVALGGGWRAVQAAAGEGLETTVTGFLESVGRLGRGRVATVVGMGAAGDPPVVELDSWFRPGITPWLTLSSSWRASDGDAERFDVSATSRFGTRLKFVLDAGLRMVPEGVLVDCSLEGTLPMRCGSVSLGAGSVGWTEPEMLLLETLEYRARMRLSIR